jgi:hypothetical protein
VGFGLIFIGMSGWSAHFLAGRGTLPARDYVPGLLAGFGATLIALWAVFLPGRAAFGGWMWLLVAVTNLVLLIRVLQKGK